jgi:hypothetical protein
VHFGEVPDEVVGSHVRRKKVVLRRVAQTRSDLGAGLPRIKSKRAQDALVGVMQTQDHADQRRLAGAVGAEQPSDAV